MAKVSDRTTKDVMTEWAKANLKPGQLYTRNQIVDWFMAYCSDFKRNTVATHVYSMSVNIPNRGENYRNVRAGSGHDLFFKEGKLFRLWVPEQDPAPIYLTNLELNRVPITSDLDEAESEESDISQGGDTFALEKDLQNFLVRNLHRLEPGLKLYESDGISGIEYNAGGRFIDILAVDTTGAFVVIELKVSRGYDRVIGQLLRYIGWVETHLATDHAVRGMIVCSEITHDLLLATNHIADRVRLFEYNLTFNISQKER